MAHSPGCLPGQEEWTGYSAVWGVLAETKPKRLDSLRSSGRTAAPSEPESRESSRQTSTIASSPRFVWQGVRYVSADDEGLDGEEFDDLDFDDLDGLDDLHLNDEENADDDEDDDLDDDVRRN